MEQQAKGSFRWGMTALALAVSLSLGASAFAQRAAQDEEAAANDPSTNISEVTARTLNEAIELMNMENYSGAQQKLQSLRLDRLSPYERGTVERIFFSIAYNQERYDDARTHLKNAIDSGGLNAVQVDEARYQSAQMFMQEERWREGAAALEEWFKTAANPNSAAYYMLAIAYYQLEDFGRALPPAKKAVELMDPAKPNESWLSMLSALHLQREEYREAIPVLQQLVTVAPAKKTYWTQLSSVHGQMEDYSNALSVLQLAYSAGLVTDSSDIIRLADLLLFNEVPYRGAQVLEAAIEKRQVTTDDKLYEKLANCWIAAGEYDKAIGPLTRAAELSSSGDNFVRLGEVQAQREDWQAAIAALERGVAKGQLRDAANAQLWLGVAHYTLKDYAAARPYFTRAAQSDRYRQTANQYLQAIRANQ